MSSSKIEQLEDELYVLYLKERDVQHTLDHKMEVVKRMYRKVKKLDSQRVYFKRYGHNVHSIEDRIRKDHQKIKLMLRRRVSLYLTILKQLEQEVESKEQEHERLEEKDECI